MRSLFWESPARLSRSSSRARAPHRLGAALPLLALLPLLAGCPSSAPGGGEASMPAEDPGAQARRLADETLIVDTHIDVPYRLMSEVEKHEEVEDVSQSTQKGDFDYPRAQAGGLDALFMSIYVPASFQTEGGAEEYADTLIDLVEGLERDHPDKFALAGSPQEVRAAVTEGKIALPMGMENGAPVEDDLANLRHFFDRGIRYITLTHAENNQICDSSYAKEKKWHGLSPFGRQVVAEMNRLGIMIDVSHVSDATFDQVIELSKAPVIASHSSCRAFTPGWERNMSDDMIRRLGEHGGVIQINFGSAFLTEAANKYSNAMHDATEEYRKANGLAEGDPAMEAFNNRYREENPYPYADVSDVVKHIEHAIEIAGIDHVGLGSDFDGVGDSLPAGLKDVSGYPNLIRALLEKGHSEDDIAKICGGNVLRVWDEVAGVAEQLQRSGQPVG